jgi:hypothetical protein
MNNRVFPTTYLWIIILMLLKVGRRKKSGKLSIFEESALYFAAEAQREGFRFQVSFPGQAVAL